MVGNIFIYIIRFIVYVLLQALVLNNVLFMDYANPYLYIFFLITLPSSVSRIQLLLISFFMGLCVDIFSSTPGYNAFAATTMAYVTPFFQTIFGPREDHNVVIIPSARSYGFPLFISYAFILALIHHFLLFVVEYGSLSQPFSLLLKTVLSAVFTTILIAILQAIKNR